MFVRYPILEVSARGDILRPSSGKGDLLRDESGDPARPRQWIKHEQIIRTCPFHMLAQFCQGIALKEQAQTPRCIGVTGLVVPLSSRIFSAGSPDGTIRAPGM